MSWNPLSDVVWEYFLLILLYIYPLKKRQNYKMAIGAGILVNILLFILVRICPLSFRIVFLGLGIISGWLVFWFSVDCSLWDAVLGITCAYASQHLAYEISAVVKVVFSFSEAQYLIVHSLIFVAVMALVYFTVVRRISDAGTYKTTYYNSILPLVVLLLFSIGLNLVSEELFEPDNPIAVGYFLICKIFAILCCWFLLWVQTSIYEKITAQNELLLERQVWKMQKDQYQLSKSSIDLINQKCHDLKHQLKAFRDIADQQEQKRYLDEIEKTVMIYDSAVRTGNQVLDTILMERSLYCEENNIKWTCMADTARMDFIDSIDLYAIMGNALDNAIESVNRISDSDKKVITVNIYPQNQIMIIRIENFYEGSIQIQNGLPQTNKPDKDYHGFGVMSMKKNVEKYGGSISFKAENQIFTLSIVIPIP